MTLEVITIPNENLRKKSSPSSFKKAKDIEGKEAVETETAIAFTKIDDKLFARLKTAMEPAINVEAIAVVAIVFSWPAPKPRDLGNISFIVFKIPGSLRLKLSLYLNPETNNAGSWTDKCKTPPNTTPQAKPARPQAGTKNKIPIIYHQPNTPTLHAVQGENLEKLISG